MVNLYNAVDTVVIDGYKRYEMPDGERIYISLMPYQERSIRCRKAVKRLNHPQMPNRYCYRDKRRRKRVAKNSNPPIRPHFLKIYKRPQQKGMNKQKKILER